MPEAAPSSAPVTNPATGEVTGEVALGSVEDARAVIDAAAAAFPRVARHLARQAHPDPVHLPRAAQLPQGRAGRDHHQRARQGRLRRPRRSVSRGQEVVEFACGIPHLLKGGFTENASTKVDVYSIRQPLGPVGDHLPVQLPGHGADVVLSHRHRRGQHRGSQAQREGPHRRAVAGQPVGRSRSAPRGLQRAPGRQDRRRRTADQPQDQVDQLRGIHPDRAVRLRHRHRRGQARPSPRRGQEPRRDPARRRPRPGRGLDGQRGLRFCR